MAGGNAPQSRAGWRSGLSWARSRARALRRPSPLVVYVSAHRGLVPFSNCYVLKAKDSAWHTVGSRQICRVIGECFVEDVVLFWALVLMRKGKGSLLKSTHREHLRLERTGYKALFCESYKHVICVSPAHTSLERRKKRKESSKATFLWFSRSPCLQVFSAPSNFSPAGSRGP